MGARPRLQMPWPTLEQRGRTTRQLIRQQTTSDLVCSKCPRGDLNRMLTLLT